jgi:hypothetical protein
MAVEVGVVLARKHAVAIEDVTRRPRIFGSGETVWTTWPSQQSSHNLNLTTVHAYNVAQ